MPDWQAGTVPAPADPHLSHSRGPQGARSGRSKEVPLLLMKFPSDTNSVRPCSSSFSGEDMNTLHKTDSQWRISFAEKKDYVNKITCF